MGEYAGMILNRPVYLIQLKFLLSSNTVHDRAMINANCDSRMRQGTRSQSNECTAADFGCGFTVRDHRHAHAYAHLRDYAFPLQSCDPGEIHFDP